ncbi:SidA/IucD/PvdA family monooxygenase [Micromonospora sp. HNM0581]|uniref:lysine N(6)-hydroxylase/L-ornithine N(5)-oxygenase family protein n=1 Tax=Micromonospora sp. HNM0581 TaxID=2716341 RepID=UPI00146B1F0B|nr:SidA/IucD/PvdA family monooxygenase [Micromonospora sp. HNM0581]NLU80643.1 SidA/IucD/PvdA family monooxygenase [Micromonospora sp. HNM0581]
MTDLDQSHYRCLGVGVGPANLSLACLLQEHAEVSNLFVDKKPAFGWHEGQLLSGASLQVSILKDLVSLSDPTNPYSFLSYLHEQGRMYHFINAQFEHVPRQEFRDYMLWASRKNPNVTFGEEVIEVKFADNAFHITTSRRQVTADNIVVGVGVVPSVPDFATPHLGETQFHISEFVTRAVGLSGRRVCVIGGGQSGAEAFLDLVARAPGELPRQVTWVSRRQNFSPIDDTPFTNDYYMPCYSDYFFGLRPQLRAEFTVRNVLTSDGISEATLREIYRRIYIHRFIDKREGLADLYPNRSVTQVTPVGNGWRITMAHNDLPGTVEELEADVIIWATGVAPTPMNFLGPIADRLQVEDGEIKINEDFGVVWDGPSDRGIFLQNAARKQRGLADPNLSLMAWRSQRIADRLRGAKSTSPLPSFLEWSPRLVAEVVR